MSVTPDHPQREPVMDPTTPEAPTLSGSETQEPPMPSAAPSRPRAYVAGCLVAAVVATAGGVALLTDDDDPNAALTPPPASTTASMAPVPTVSAPPKPEDLAVAAAKTRYQDYLRVTQQVAQGGYKSIELYDSVAVSPETSVLLQVAEQQAMIGTSGAIKVLSLTAQSVTLDPTGEYPSVRLLACLDVSQVTATDATGKSLVPADRPGRLKSEAVVQNIPPGAFTDGRQPGWYVAEIEQRGDSC